MRVLRPALEALARNHNKTAEQEAEQRELAQAFRDAAFRYALAAPVADALSFSDLLFGPDAEQDRLLAETAAYRQGASDLARGMEASEFFDGISPGKILAELRSDAPAGVDPYLDVLIQLAGARHIPRNLLSEAERRNLHHSLGRQLVTAARGIEQERWGGRPLFSHQGELAQWDALHAEFQHIAGAGSTETDARAVQNGIYEETGRRFYPGVLSGISDGLLGAIGRVAPRPIRLTPEMLDNTGRFLGQRNAGSKAPRFTSWLSKPENVLEIMPGGQVRYTTRIDAAESVFNGKLVSVSYTDGIPDFSQIGLVRVNIRNPVGRGPGGNGKADLKAASRVLWREIQAGRVSHRMFTQKQLEDIAAGKDRMPNLTWHHDGIRLNVNGTGPMLLLDRTAHKAFQHIGWASKIKR